MNKLAESLVEYGIVVIIAGILIAVAIGNFRSQPGYPPFMSGHAVAAAAHKQTDQEKADAEFDAMDVADAAASAEAHH